MLGRQSLGSTRQGGAVPITSATTSTQCVNVRDINFGTGRTARPVFANGGHSCALLDNGGVKCWGMNTWGMIGLNTGNSGPGNKLSCAGGPRDCIGDEPGEMGNALVAAIASNVVKFTLGFRHDCALLGTNQLKCWGTNEEAQIGLGDITGNNVIIGDQANEIANLATTALKSPTIEELTGGGFHTCVWNTDDTLNCWGDNRSGQLGHNDLKSGATVRTRWARRCRIRTPGSN